jgi:hypothetical protein
MTQPSARAETLLQHARVQYARGNHDACRRDLDAALGLVRGSGLPVETALLVQDARLTIWTSHPESVRNAALAALAAARETASFVADAQRIAAQALYLDNDAGCIEHFAAAAAAALAAGNDDVEFEARLFHAVPARRTTRTR